MKKRCLSLLLAMAVTVSSVPLNVFAKIAPGTDFGYNRVVSSKEYSIAPGITETDLVLNNDEGSAQNKGYLLEVDLKNPTTNLVATYKDHDPSSWGLQPLAKQAEVAEKALKNDSKYGEDARVVGAVNANFFNMGTGEPIGAFVMDGKIIQNTNRDYGYLAILNDGSAEIRRGTTPIGENVVEAVAGYEVLALDGKNLANSSQAHDQTKRQPRNVVGIKQDGSMMFLLADGRQAPSSHGMTLFEASELMLSMGCVQVLRLDDGGSATMAARREGSDKLAIINSPSDGAPRAVSSSLLIVSTAKPSGVFDHASISPKDELYTPNTKVQFEAQGIDSAGMSVPLPEGVKWALDSNSQNLGTIDSNTGLFVANENTGIVNVQLKLGEEVVGTSTIEIVTPDAIEFSSEEISLGFEDTTDFGLVLRNKGREINHKVGDVNWLISEPKLGTFNGNEFTSSDGESLNGTITAVSAFNSSVRQSIHVIVGMLPTVVMDFEDYTDPITGNKIPAKEYYTIGNEGDGSKYYTSNYNRGGKQSAEIVSIDDDEPVRFGSYSLKLNYDFRNCGAVTEGANFGTSELLTVPGSPTGIGVWVYAPEGTGIKWEGEGTQAGFWLRGYVRDGNGNNMPYDFTLEPKAIEPGSDQQPGIYWEGWKYLEADLTKLTAPFAIQPGMTFRLMYVAGTPMGTKTAGSIYFDNLQFVYGANVDDIDSPVIDTVTANNVTLTDGMEINTNKVTFSGDFYDVLNKYTSGIDKDTIRMNIDGVNVAGNDNFNFVVDPDGSKAHLYDVTLLNGQHSLTVSLRDKFGNDTSKTIYFTVNGQDLGVPTVKVDTKETSAILGETVTIEIRADDATNISKNTTSFKLNKQFLDYEVIASENYDVTSSFNKITDTLTLDAIRKATGTTEDNLIASIKVKIPANLNENDQFTYTVKAGSYLVNDVLYTYSTPEIVLPVGAAYTLTSEPIITGESGVLKVTNSNNNPASNVTVYLQDNTVIGTTDENGILTTDKFSGVAGDYVVYVKDANGKISFFTTVSSYDAKGDINGTPFNILNNAVKDPATQKNISWMTNPKFESTQVVQYRLNNTTAWKTVDVNSKDVIFTKEANSIVQVNNVVLTGLMANTTYQYRVGCENKWSEIMTFVTTSQNRPVDFFIFGDVQADDMTNINALLENVGKQNYAFGIQTGDAVDDAISYQNWQEMLELLDVNSLKDSDLIHVLGNHEYSGDGNGLKGSTIYNLPVNKAGGYYSVTYGNVYVAVINYTGTATQLQEALDWLKQDASNSDAKWKILTMHQPPYYTNIAGGNAQINTMVPPVVDELGIDFVFSGHDHSYARTEPLKDRVVNQNGTVYFISGSSGEKSYTITNNPDFHFAKATQDFNAIYLGVSSTQNDITVTTYDVQADGTANIIDTYTKSIETCVNDEHTYLYDANYDELVCKDCGYTISAGKSLYGGFAKDMNSGRLMYFSAGKALTGHQYIESTHYYFDENGLGLQGNYNIDGQTCVFDKGQFVKCTTADVLLAGLSGAKSNFILYSDGTLKICGSGQMDNHVSRGTVPWVDYILKVKKVVIGSQITSIGAYSFSYLQSCREVVFEENSQLKYINDLGFYFMSNLKEIIIPEGVTSIGNYAFAYDKGLEKVYIPNSVSFINKTAFNNGNKDKLVLEVGEGSYAEKFAKENAIEYVYHGWVPEEPEVGEPCGENARWHITSDGTLKITGSGKLYSFYSTGFESVPWYNSRHEIKKVEVGKDITEITTYSFKEFDNCTSVVFEEGSKLNKIGSDAFRYMKNLKELKLPEGLQTISNVAFADTGLESISIPASVQSIHKNAFYNVDKDKLVIYIEKDSFAQEFAKANGFKYITNKLVDSVTLNKTELELLQDSTETLVATINPTDTTSSLTWKSSNENVATVDVNGKVTAKGAGTAVITVTTVNGKTASCKVTVSQEVIEVTSITLDKTVLKLNVGENSKLTATINPTNATNKTLTWRSSDEEIVSVDQFGHIIAKKEGTVTITVETSNGVNDTCTVYVSNRLLHGWVYENNAWYYYDDGVMQTGWLNLSGTWYLLSDTGERLSGWQNVGGYWYYFNEDGIMQTGWLNDSGTWYLLADSGYMLTDWQAVGGYWYYFNASGSMQTGWLNDSGTWYLLADSGYMLTGWQKVSGYWYYLSTGGSMQTGWLNDSGTWYLLADSGYMLTGWQKVSGYWYYLSTGGSMQTGWLYDSGNWYLLADSGYMLTGWQLVNGTWYYLNSSGVWVA